jgi:hypothetical protein
VMECMANGSLWGLLHNQSFVFETELALPILRDIMQVPPPPTRTLAPSSFHEGPARGLPRAPPSFLRADTASRPRLCACARAVRGPEGPEGGEPSAPRAARGRVGGATALILANSSINLPGHVSVFISESSLANPGYVNPGGLFIDK